MKREEIMNRVIEILSNHEEHTSEGGIYWEYEWVGGKEIPDENGGYRHEGGERVSAEEAFYKEMTDFISQELDKAREEVLEDVTFQLWARLKTESFRIADGRDSNLGQDIVELTERYERELHKLKKEEK